MSTAHGITPPVADSGELADPEPAVAGVELLGVEPPGVAPPGVEPPGVAPPGVESDGVGVGPVGVGVGSLGFDVGVDPPVSAACTTATETVRAASTARPPACPVTVASKTTVAVTCRDRRIGAASVPTSPLSPG